MASIHKFTMPGEMVKRGFWLYVWRVDTPKGERLYVGRTGDNSSPYATAPYTRMGQHLGFTKASNSLRRLLEEEKIEPEKCKKFEIISYGPIYPEKKFKKGQDPKNKKHIAKLMEEHKPVRDKNAAMERDLCKSLKAGNYRVLNTVNSLKDRDEEAWKKVYKSFNKYFPNMKPIEPQRTH